MKKFIICAICAFCGLTASAQAKFGHVNSQEIIQAMPEFTTAQADIQKLTQQYEADLKSMQDELQKKAEAFEKEESTLPDNIKQRRNQEAQQEKMQAITSKVLDAIKAVGQEGNYVYIMEMGAGIPYISTTLSTDVTAQVKAKLGLK